jgi:uncharacterized protein
MTKEFIPYDTVRDNAILLGARIAREFGVPDIVYVSLRGGAALGNILSEYLQLLSPGRKVLYGAVVAKSYHDIFSADARVRVEGWTLSPDRLPPGSRILLADDIFDTGRTVNHLVGLFLEQGFHRKDIAVAVHDYKIREFDTARPSITPDFWCRRHVVTRPEDDFWLHYLSHELKSLTQDEIVRYYTGGNAGLTEAFRLLDHPPAGRA